MTFLDEIRSHDVCFSTQTSSVLKNHLLKLLFNLAVDTLDLSDHEFEKNDVHGQHHQNPCEPKQSILSVWELGRLLNHKLSFAEGREETHHDVTHRLAVLE